MGSQDARFINLNAPEMQALKDAADKKSAADAARAAEQEAAAAKEREKRNAGVLKFGPDDMAKLRAALDAKKNEGWDQKKAA